MIGPGFPSISSVLACDNLKSTSLPKKVVTVVCRMAFIARCLLVLVFLATLGCSAQEPASAPDPQLKQRIVRQLRERYRLPPQVQVTIGPIQQDSKEFPGYDAITATLGGGGATEVHEFLISKDRKTLIRMSKMDISKDPYEEVMGRIDLKGRAIKGKKDAQITIVNYDDYQCPYCAEMHNNLQSAVNQFPDSVRLVYKDFPLPFHRWATRAAINANCLSQLSSEAFWDFADNAHTQAGRLSNSEGGLQTAFSSLDKMAMESGDKHKVDAASLRRCIEQQPDTMLKQSMEEGKSLGIEGTPTVFINGERLPGLVSEEQIVAIIKQQLQEQNRQAESVR